MNFGNMLMIGALGFAVWKSIASGTGKLKFDPTDVPVAPPVYKRLPSQVPMFQTMDFVQGRDWIYSATGTPCPPGWRKQMVGTRSERCIRGTIPNPISRIPVSFAGGIGSFG